MRHFSFHFTNIRSKLIVFFVGSFLAPFLILSFSAWHNYQKTINNSSLLYTQEIMSLSATKLDDFFSKLDQFYFAVYSKNLNQTLALMEQNSTTGVRATLSLSDTVSQLRFYYGLAHVIPYISIINSDGEILYQNDLALSSDYNFTSAEWFTDFCHSEESTCLSPAQRLPYHESKYASPSALYMTYARKIPRNGITSQQYYFLVEFDIDHISSLLTPLIKGDDGNLILLSGNLPIYIMKKDMLFDKTPDFFLKSLSDKQSSTYVTLNHHHLLLNCYSFRNNSLQILCINDLKELTKDVPTLKNLTLFLSFLCFALAILLANIFASKLVKPIHKLKAVTYEVMQGHLDVTVPELPNDEIGDLGKCIDQMLTHIQELIQKTYEYSIREKEMQIKTLQSQINPHFLYNTLETISAIAESEGIDEISNITINMANLYRYSIKASDRLVPLKDELAYVENYLYIMRIRYDQRICFSFSIEQEAYSWPVMCLTLQPIVENAIYHGLEPKFTPGNLKICASVKENFLYLTVSDDGVGMSDQQLSDLQNSLTDPSSPHSTKHIGLCNVYQRLKLCFGEMSSMTIESKPDRGTTVTLRLPMAV